MKILVTQEHIEKGCRVSSGFCPIALAVSAATLIDNVGVTRNRIRIGALCLKTPRSANRFINRFDRWLEVKPFSFTLKEVI